MTNRSETGKRGEDLACQYLREKGYKILARNFRQKWDEIDIIAKSPENILAFVEVKTIRSRHQLTEPGNNPAIAELLPEENLSRAKLRKLKRSASFYAGCHQELISEKRGWRIDLVAITLEGKNYKLNHYENI